MRAEQPEVYWFVLGVLVLIALHHSALAAPASERLVPQAPVLSQLEQQKAASELLNLGQLASERPVPGHLTARRRVPLEPVQFVEYCSSV